VKRGQGGRHWQSGGSSEKGCFRTNQAVACRSGRGPTDCEREADMTEPVDKSGFVELKRALQAFQAARLNKTYTDLKNSEEYGKIGRFFFEKLYAPEDFSFRNTSITKLHQLMQRQDLHRELSRLSARSSNYMICRIRRMTAW
jgi:hypothetical protein